MKSTTQDTKNHTSTQHKQLIPLLFCSHE